MSFENFDQPDDTIENTELGSFQNPSFFTPHDLMPKIDFTTDIAETEAAANADHSSSFPLPDNSFFVGLPLDYNEVLLPAGVDAGSFLNDTFDIGITTFIPDLPDTTGAEGTGDYAYTPDQILRKIEDATQELTDAQLRLEEAIANGSNITVCMSMVETAEKMLDTYNRMYNDAVAAQLADAAKG